MKSPYKSSFIVDLVLRLWQAVPALVLHNLEKAHAIKKIFWHLNVDQLDGCYIEFGVAHGHSMRSAEIAERTSKSKVIGVKRAPRNLFGFDTFEGFVSHAADDKHPVWEGTMYTAPISKIEDRFRNSRNVHFIKMDARKLVGIDGNTLSAKEFGVTNKAALILFDMDLYEPTLSALRWSRQLLQTGTFLLFDEFFAFGGDLNKGESRALNEFLSENPDIHLRDYSSYGAGGRIFVVQVNELK
jgi:hypothetical protein